MSEPYYSDELVTLYHGDCREVTEWLEADVLVTDPPYGIAYSRRAGIKTAAKGDRGHGGIRGDNDTVARDEMLGMWGGGRPGLVFGDPRYPPPGWARMLVFAKPATTGVIGSWLPWRRDWEPIYVIGSWPRTAATRSAVIPTGRKSAGGWSGYTSEAGHPHAKPLDVLDALIGACPPGTVADPFTGSGSTLVAAKRLGRKAIGVELEERYCEIAAKRLAQGVLDFGAVS